MRKKKENKILEYMNTLSNEEIVEREKEFHKKALIRTIGGGFFFIGGILALIILLNIM